MKKNKYVVIARIPDRIIGQITLFVDVVVIQQGAAEIMKFIFDVIKKKVKEKFDIDIEGVSGLVLDGVYLLDSEQIDLNDPRLKGAVDALKKAQAAQKESEEVAVKEVQAIKKPAPKAKKRPARPSKAPKK